MPVEMPSNLPPRPGQPRVTLPASGRPAPVTPVAPDSLTASVLKGSAVGLSASLMVHVALLVLAAFVVFQASSTVEEGTVGDVEIAVVETVQFAGAPAGPAHLADAPDATIPDYTPGLLPAGPGLDGPSGDSEPGSGGDLGDIADGLGGAGAGGGLGTGSGMGAGGSGGGAASFFGVEAQGSRFVYIVDVSGSMRGEKLDALKVELNESIGSLLEHMNFMVIFFASDSFQIGSRTKWITASDDSKKWSRARIAEVESSGGTVPNQAFEIAFQMQPRPDAIYFMTDGLFDPAVAETIKWLNRSGRKVPVHCIAFMDSSSEATMKQIAKESNGTYTFIRQIRSPAVQPTP